MSGEDSEDFDWMAAEPVIRGQQPIAVYIGGHGDIVVRQDGDWYRREDAWITIRPENAKSLVDAVMALALELGATHPSRLALPAPAPADPTAADRQRRYRERKRNGHTVTGTTVTLGARNGPDLFPD